MSTKNPRGPRKPLDQSFLDFVHGSEDLRTSESKPEAALSEDAQRLSQVEVQLTQLKQQVEQMDQNANQPLAELKQRLNELEKTLLDRESKHFSRVDSQLTHLTQQVERLEAHFGQTLTDELHYYSAKPEEEVSSQAIDHGSPVEGQPTQPTQSIELDVERNHFVAPEPIKAPERRSESDSLLSHMGPLLDNF